MTDTTFWDRFEAAGGAAALLQPRAKTTVKQIMADARRHHADVVTAYQSGDRNAIARVDRDLSRWQHELMTRSGVAPVCGMCGDRPSTETVEGLAVCGGCADAVLA